jgi:hypothetical protein
MRVKNMSWSPCLVTLADDKRKVVKARQSLEVGDQDLESPQVKKLLADRTLIVLPEAEAKGKKKGGEK